jgi:mono/diheme cytochrome c family protein
VEFFESRTDRMKKLILIASLLGVAGIAEAEQPETPAITPEQIKIGSALYALHCAACHGPRMADPEGAFDLRKFPPDQHDRFIRSVTKGKGSMPPWGGLLKSEEIEALWGYVVAGEKK